MLLDEYARNVKTGELLPCTEAIHEFYKTHGALERWTDEWEPTGTPVPGSNLAAPNFARAVNI